MRRRAVQGSIQQKEDVGDQRPALPDLEGLVRDPRASRFPYRVSKAK